MVLGITLLEVYERNAERKYHCTRAVRRSTYQRIRNLAYKLAFEPVIILISFKNVKCQQTFLKFSNCREFRYKLVVSPLYCQARKLSVLLICIGRI